MILSEPSTRYLEISITHDWLEWPPTTDGEDGHKSNGVNNLMKFFRMMLLGFVPFMTGCFLLPPSAEEHQLFLDLLKRLESSNTLEVAFSKVGVQFNGVNGFAGNNIRRTIIVIYIYLDKAVEPPEGVLEFIEKQTREMGLQNAVIVRFAVGQPNEGKVYKKLRL